jgi:hypothetical protein
LGYSPKAAADSGGNKSSIYSCRAKRTVTHAEIQLTCTWDIRISEKLKRNKNGRHKWSSASTAITSFWG